MLRRSGLVLVLVLITVAVTVQVVRAQMVFPDGSIQDTAFPGFAQVPTGAAFTSTVFFASGAASGPLSSNAVPAGQELVVLKVIGWNTVLSTLDSRLPSPNQNVSPVTLSMLIRPDGANNTLFETDFPDGAVVVDSGRQPYIAFRSATNFAVTTSSGAQSITVIGYLRQKS